MKSIEAFVRVRDGSFDDVRGCDAIQQNALQKALLEVCKNIFDIILNGFFELEIWSLSSSVNSSILGELQHVCNKFIKFQL